MERNYSKKVDMFLFVQFKVPKFADFILTKVLTIYQKFIKLKTKTNLCLLSFISWFKSKIWQWGSVTTTASPSSFAVEMYSSLVKLPNKSLFEKRSSSTIYFYKFKDYRKSLFYLNSNTTFWIRHFNSVSYYWLYQ